MLLIVVMVIYDNADVMKCFVLIGTSKMNELNTYGCVLFTFKEYSD